MWSGIGDAGALADLGIAPVVDLPEVGRNLADHPLVPALLFAARRPLPGSRFNHCESMVIARSSLARGMADLQLMVLSRSAERRVGKECVSSCRSRLSP